MKKKQKENLKYLSLNNDPITKGVTTFKSDVSAIVAVMMPSDFVQWESVTIVYKALKSKT